LREPSDTTIKVPVAKLSTLCEQYRLQDILAIKVDVEGHEDRIIAPFLRENSEKNYPKVIVLEYIHSMFWEVDLIRLCIESGYREVGRTRSCVLLSLDGSGDVIDRGTEHG